MTEEEGKLLISAMEDLGSGKYHTIDEKAFQDKKLAKAYNKMVEGVITRSNHYLMRINDSMQKIADTSWVQTMLEQIASQQEPIEELANIRNGFNRSLVNLENLGIELLTYSRQLRATVGPVVRSSEDMIAGLQEIRESVGDELIDDVDEVVDQMAFTGRSIHGMQKRLDIIIDNISAIYEEVNKQNQLAKPLLQDVDQLSESYGELSVEAFNAGEHMYRISRDIDNARNDMFRTNSAPTLIDRLKVFYVDHYTLTWRLYNHIAEFETLQLRQLNNPDRCKFGLWCRNDVPEWLKETESFQRAFTIHDELHHHAVACYKAKENYNVNLAMEEFHKTLHCMEEYKTALDDMAKECRKHGEAEETPVWKYTGL